MRVSGVILEVGPLNIPVWLLLTVVGFVLAQIVARLLRRDRKEQVVAVNDKLTTALLVGFLVWKLTPLLTRFPEITASPLRLLYYPGGTPGLVAGFIAASAYGAISFRRAWDRVGLTIAVVAPQVALIVALPILLVGVSALIPVDGSVERGGETVTLLERQEGIREDVPVDLSVLDGPSVFVYWATWCGPCTAQMPEVERAWDEVGQLAPIYAVNLTYTEDSVSDVEEYRRNNALSFPIVLDYSGELAQLHGVTSTPTTLVFDAAGALVARRTGSVNADWIVGRVLPHLE